MINEVYDMKDLGVVVGGVLLKGTIRPNTKLYLNKNCIPVTVKTIHKKQLPQQKLFTDETASMMLAIAPEHAYMVDKYSWLFSNKSFAESLRNNFKTKSLVSLFNEKDCCDGSSVSTLEKIVDTQDAKMESGSTNSLNVIPMSPKSRAGCIAFIGNMIQGIKFVEFGEDGFISIEFENKENYGLINQGDIFYIKTQSNEIYYGIVEV